MKAEKQSYKTGSAVNLSTSALNITGLLGDTYDYTIIARFTNASADSILDITLNSDTTANYRNYEMKGLSSTASAAVGDSDTAIELQNIIGTANPGLLIMSITGSSGDERYIDCFYSGDGAILKQSSYWKNTADEVDEITFTAASSVTCDYEVTIYRTPKEASQEKWELVDIYNASGVNYNTSPTTIFSNLKGDTDLQYKLVIRTDTGFDSRLRLRMNGDSGANYTAQRLSNNGGTISAGNSTGRNGFQWSDLNIDHDSVATIIINAESGAKRLISSSESNNQTKGNEQDEQACWWNNTVDELTSIVLYDATNVANDTIEAKLYRRKNPNTIGDTLPFEMVEEVAVSGDFSAGHTFSGLSGDDVLMYKLEWLGDGGAAANTTFYAQFNGDTTNTNYVNQLLYAQNSSVLASQSTTAYPGMIWVVAYGDECHSTTYFYPKSGKYRPALCEASAESAANDFVVFDAGWWENSTDTVDSIKIYASTTDSFTGTLKLSRIMAKVPFLTYSHTWGGAAQIQSNEADLESTSSSYIQVTDDSANWDLGTGAFTIEIENLTFESFPAIGGLDDIYRIIGEGRGISGTGPRKTGWTMSYDKTNNELRLDRYDGTTVTTKKVSWTASTATAYDLAIVRDGDNVYFYVDGTQQGSTQTGVSATSYNREEANGLYIGSYEYGGGPTTSYLDGQIGAIRVENVARYTGSSYTVESLINTRNTLYLNTFTGADTSTPSENTP